MEPPIGYGSKHRSIFRSPAYGGATGFPRTGVMKSDSFSSPNASRLINVAMVMIDSAASKIRSETLGMAIPTRNQVRFRMAETAADRDAILLFIG
jgi:hypothetical protein